MIVALLLGLLLNSPPSTAWAPVTHRRPVQMRVMRASSAETETTTTRRGWLAAALSVGGAAVKEEAQAISFDGGAGGLGKVKPETGVVLMDRDLLSDEDSTPADRNGPVTLLSNSGVPVEVKFAVPSSWKRNDRLAARDFTTGDGAYVLVAEGKGGSDEAGLLKIVKATVFGKAGKLGAYGEPSDVKLKSKSKDGDYEVFEFTFTTLTPALRESERRLVAKCRLVSGDVFILVGSATANRWKNAVGDITTAISSFEAAPSKDASAAMAVYKRRAERQRAEDCREMGQCG